MDQYPQQTPHPQWPGFPPAQPTSSQGQPGYPLQPGGNQLPYPPQSQPGYIPPQPGYPSQPGYPVQTSNANRKRLWVALIIVAVLLVGGISTFVYFVRGQNTPTATLQQFCDGLKNLDAPAVYNTLSTGAKAKPENSPAEMQASFDNLKKSEREGKGSFTGCNVTNVQQNGSTATGLVTLIGTDSNGQPRSTSITVYLIQENGQWKVDNVGSFS